ncbi:hypothetical protein G5B47_17240 [Paenibacillus sp. 7124]|uniref:Uncharacterized protein n=1 Tax=Paenibacillus apii TaxID=1850370 RepID=A0A6M1PQ25_9BACL|nr:hypothetical protein [Paenibacillus apii]NGM84162.1 hypothetical protein [Paenibacillus apii]NJJ38657.1 hypothetical protein [Paenibacillus apii]
MRRKFVSPPTNELEWLQESYEKRKNRFLELGIKAIDVLVKEGKLKRYMQLTKPELVDLLIRMEQYIAHQNQIWLKYEFEKFTKK